MRQTGFGHATGSPHFQSHFGFSQTLLQGWTLGQSNRQSGSAHCVWQPGQLEPAQGRCGHTTEHFGSSQRILQLDVSGAWQRVSQRGAAHCGTQI